MVRRELVVSEVGVVFVVVLSKCVRFGVAY